MCKRNLRSLLHALSPFVQQRLALLLRLAPPPLLATSLQCIDYAVRNSTIFFFFNFFSICRGFSFIVLLLK